MKKGWKIVFISAASLALACILAGVSIFFSTCQSGAENEKLKKTAKKTESSLSELEKKEQAGIDFKSLKKINEDIYAWITIPNTGVDYPILQSYSESDSYYLYRNFKKERDINGSIYTEKHNKTDFSDRVTVVYGHDMLDGSMFKGLHKFRDEDFFKKNKYIYIYLPDKTLTYTIVSAYRSDDRHILNSFDFSEDEVFEGYLDEISDPRSMIVNKRKMELSVSDRIITLSTCIGTDGNYRYLVQGVLTDEKSNRS